MELEGVAVVKVEECEGQEEEDQPALDLSRTKVAAVALEGDGVKTEPKVEVADDDGDEEDEVVRRSRPADTTTSSLRGE